MGRSRWIVAGTVIGLVGVVSAGTATASAGRSKTTTVVYDSFQQRGGYTMADYQARWSNSFGLGEMALEDTRSFAGGRLSVEATPFRTGVDFSVFDHLKYIAISNESFAVPERGSVTFSADIRAATPGTEPGHVVHGTYGPPGSYPNGAPWSATVLETQQASASLHMVDFATGQLFDWLVGQKTAVALIERLPSNVTGSPSYVGPALMYTQLVKEVKITPGTHTYAIRYTREGDRSLVEYCIDGKVVAKVQRVGVPLDVQGVRYTGISPSLGPGEELADEITSFSMAHGMISLLDAFPYQHPEVPELSVSVPLEERLFGQGLRASYDNFTVTTTT
jgi:hypothetical protein